MTSKNLSKYETTYSYNELLKKHGLNEVGVWRVRGEDPNCDLGGSHHMPELGYFSGKLSDVIAFAVELPGFWQWGGGGDITLIRYQKVDHQSNAKHFELLKEKDALLVRIAQIDQELHNWS